MALTLCRYSWLVALQFLLLAVDMFINAFGLSLTRNNFGATILMLVSQEIMIIVEYTLFVTALRHTCIFQMDGSLIVLRKMKLYMFSSWIYFMLSALQHLLIIFGHRSSGSLQMATLDNLQIVETPLPLAFNVLAVVQRLVAVFYYYSAKSAALTIADPRFTEQHIDWITAQVQMLNSMLNK